MNLASNKVKYMEVMLAKLASAVLYLGTQLVWLALLMFLCYVLVDQKFTLFFLFVHTFYSFVVMYNVVERLCICVIKLFFVYVYVGIS